VRISTIKSCFFYLRSLQEIKRQAADNLFPFGKLYPCIEDRFKQSGDALGHYFHQDLLVANKIFLNKPVRHVDIGSRVDGFVAHVASFRKIEVLDIRELDSRILNVEFRRFDLMDENPGMADYCDSMSCLHALEHFGLGRYGDRVEYYGYMRGWENIKKILQSGGKFYFSVPIGPQRIEFNAHRVFSLAYLKKLISPDYRIDSFSYVDDKGDLNRDADLESAQAGYNFGCRYGCGIFELTRKGKMP
jgi:SAM-dependent methyltransferase